MSNVRNPLVSTVLMTLHMPGSLHWKPSYGDPGVAGFFVYLFSIPDHKRLFSVNSSNYGKYRISPDRSLRDEYDYGENVGIESLLMEKNRKYSFHLDCSRPPLMFR